MSQWLYLVLCIFTSLTIAIPWGAFLYWFMGTPGKVLGLVLFFMTLAVLLHRGWHEADVNPKDLDEEKGAAHEL